MEPSSEDDDPSSNFKGLRVTTSRSLAKNPPPESINAVLMTVTMKRGLRPSSPVALMAESIESLRSNPLENAKVVVTQLSLPGRSMSTPNAHGARSY